MRIIFKNVKETALYLMRRAEYGFEKRDFRTGEDVFSRRLGVYEYPKFHVYAKKDGENNLIVNLHLDQKKPVYKGTTAHSGEYDGEIIEKEAERIRGLINKEIY